MKKQIPSLWIHILLWMCISSISELNVWSQTLYVPSGLSGIGSSSTGNVGVGVSNPSARFAVGATGNSSIAGYFYNPTTVSSYCIGSRSESAANSSWSMGGIGYATLNSSSDRAIGLSGQAFSSTSLSNGRSFGVQGDAGNATSGYNYGLYGRLSYSNNGAAVFGTIYDTYGGEEDTQGQYAGYFKGKVYMNSQLSIGYKTATYTLDVNGYIRGYNLTPSDERLKENVNDIKGALNNLTSLRGVTYKLKTNGISLLANKLALSATPDTGLKVKANEIINEPELYSRNHIGFLAQDLQKIFPELVYTDKDGVLSVDYISLIPVLVESIKELNAKTLDLQALKDKLTVIENRLNECCNSGNLKSGTVSTGNTLLNDLSKAVLYQNYPNPFTHNTAVAYYLPESTREASMTIYNMEGQQVKVIEINEVGKNQVNIIGGELNPGMYFYTLIADGKEIDTKKMILTK